MKKPESFENKARKINVVSILSDDQGIWALGCSGNSEIRTPNLDGLAGSGMRFNNFFCTSPVCSPARASLLTGRLPSQHGVHDWIREGNVGAGARGGAVGGAIEYLAGQTAYTDILAERGYTCGLSGKWHLGAGEKSQKGFSYWYAHQRGGGPYYNAPMVLDGRLIEEEGYVTDLITDRALSYMQSCLQRRQPFYVSVHYTAPHYPWLENHPEEIVHSYDDCPFDSCPQEPDHPWIGPHDFIHSIKPNVRANLRGYFASVTAMDRNIGRILDLLRKNDVLEDTLVCFLSDNGFNCGHHGIWGKGNGTFPLNMYDTSVKVPAIFSQPGRIPAGKVSDELVSGYDFMPTLLDYLGLGKVARGEGLPGTSFLPLLLGEQREAREHVVIYSEYGPTRMIRSREWKYVHRFPYGPHELYDMIHGPHESRNLVDEEGRRNLVEHLRKNLDAWFREFVNPQFDGVYEPVTGHGQIYLSGRMAGGRTAFAPPEKYEF